MYYYCKERLYFIKTNIRFFFNFNCVLILIKVKADYDKRIVTIFLKNYLIPFFKICVAHNFGNTIAKV